MIDPDTGRCPCGHDVVDGDCLVFEHDGTEHRVPTHGPANDACRCCGLSMAQIERPRWWD